MKAVAIAVLLAIASPAFAETPAVSQSASEKPFIYDGPGLNSFSPPESVAIGTATVVPVPAIETRPVVPQRKPLPRKPKESLG